MKEVKISSFTSKQQFGRRKIEKKQEKSIGKINFKELKKRYKYNPKEDSF